MTTNLIDALIKEQQFENARQVLEQAKTQGVDGERLTSLEEQPSPKTQIEYFNSASPSQQQLNSLLEYYQNGRCIQKTLNIIRNKIEAVDADTKWAALELMLASSASVVALAKKMTKPDTKTVTRKISIPKTKVIKQPIQQASKPAVNHVARTAIKPITPQKPLPNQQIS